MNIQQQIQEVLKLTRERRAKKLRQSLGVLTQILDREEKPEAYAALAVAIHKLKEELDHITRF